MSSDNSNNEPRVGTKVTENKCDVCKDGQIVEETKREPSGENQWSLITRYHCAKCGTHCVFFPGEKRRHKVAV